MRPIMLTPSAAVSVLEASFPFVAQPPADGKVGGNFAGKVAALTSVIERIPDALIVLEPADHAAFVAAVAELQSALAIWQSRGTSVGDIKFVVFRSIRDLLLKCPDRAGAGAVAAFDFIKDPALEADLAMDMTEVNTALANAEWKSATVIAGSVVEALLLWEHQQDATRTGAAVKAVVAKQLIKQPAANVLEWTLHPFIEVAFEAGVLTDRTAKLARLTKDYRNLIHPGRAARLAQKPDRSTALAATAAAEAVIAELRALHMPSSGPSVP